MAKMHTKLKRDSYGIAVLQEPIGGFDISYNPDDDRFYVCDHNDFGDLETRATFAGDSKGFHNARAWARANEPKVYNFKGEV